MYSAKSPWQHHLPPPASSLWSPEQEPPSIPSPLHHILQTTTPPQRHHPNHHTITTLHHNILPKRLLSATALTTTVTNIISWGTQEQSDNQHAQPNVNMLSDFSFPHPQSAQSTSQQDRNYLYSGPLPLLKYLAESLHYTKLTSVTFIVLHFLVLSSWWGQDRDMFRVVTFFCVLPFLPGTRFPCPSSV